MKVKFEFEFELDKKKLKIYWLKRHPNIYINNKKHVISYFEETLKIVWYAVLICWIVEKGREFDVNSI